MASKMRECSIRGVKDCARIPCDDEFGRHVLAYGDVEAAEEEDSPDCKAVWITGWSKFGEHELDFGFRKPEWVSLCDVPVKDMLFILMNTKDNEGIEAWVYLEKDEYIRRLTTPSSKM